MLNIELPEPCKTCECAGALRLAIIKANLELTEEQLLKIFTVLDSIPNCPTCPATPTHVGPVSPGVEKQM